MQATATITDRLEITSRIEATFQFYDSIAEYEERTGRRASRYDWACQNRRRVKELRDRLAGGGA